jgi:hypothetical protein
MRSSMGGRDTANIPYLEGGFRKSKTKSSSESMEKRSASPGARRSFATRAATDAVGGIAKDDEARERRAVIVTMENILHKFVMGRWSKKKKKGKIKEEKEKENKRHRCRRGLKGRDDGYYEPSSKGFCSNSYVRARRHNVGLLKWDTARESGSCPRANEREYSLITSGPQNLRG